jgi:hypothetical protein
MDIISYIQKSVDLLFQTYPSMIVCDYSLAIKTANKRKLPFTVKFTAKKWGFAVSVFRLQQTNKLPSTVSSVFRVYVCLFIYIYI